MDEFGRLTIGVMAALALCLAPALCGGWLLQRRKRNARRLRRSPLTTALLRSPGQTLREKMEDVRIDVGMDMMLMMFTPTFPLAFLQIHSVVTHRQPSPEVLVLVTLSSLAIVGWQIRKIVKRSWELHKLRLGFDAEVAIGQELEHLVREGAYVFHDLPAGKFNIDHVVVAPAGVFAIETKGYTKPNREGGAEDATVIYNGHTLVLPDRSGSWALEQSIRQAKWLSGWLTGAVGAPVTANPVVAMPGWYVQRKGTGEVVVLSGKELPKHLLKARADKPLAGDQLQRVVHQLDQKCRNVLPSYRHDDATK